MVRRTADLAMETNMTIISGMANETQKENTYKCSFLKETIVQTNSSKGL